MKKVIVALDGMGLEECENFLSNSGPKIKFIKIGMELFYKYGRESLQRICTKYNVEVFLDLKIYDIPNTAYGAIKSLEGLPIKFLTLHLQGGKEMIIKAKEARDKYIPNCLILGVSYLTSFSENNFDEIWGYSDSCSRSQAFERLFKMARSTQIDGVVCSAFEVAKLKEIDSNILAVTPGIRFKEDSTDDQKRVMTPAQALANGSDYLVIGRSLTNDGSNLSRKIQCLDELF